MNSIPPGSVGAGTLVAGSAVAGSAVAGSAVAGTGVAGTGVSGAIPADVAAIARPIARRGVCLVVAAPSGAGKSTISRALLDSEAELSLSVSVTTRAPRPGEQEGVHYFFRSQAEFAALREAGALLEWAEVFGRFYGTPKQAVQQALDAGRDVIFDIDWQGHRQLRAALPGDVVGVFVLPPSLEALDARLRRRGGDAPAEIARRMAAARREIAHWQEFDHVVVNTVLETAVSAVRSVLHAARLATARQRGLERFVAGLEGAGLKGAGLEGAGPKGPGLTGAGA